MKIVVTGGSGFIGHNVVSMLEKLGHECAILDNQTNYGLVPSHEMKALHEERRSFYQAPVHRIDLRDNPANTEWLIDHYQPDTVIHLASFPRQKVVSADPRWGSDVMMGGTISLLEASRRNDCVQRFVYVSSSMVYGNFTTNINEDAACNPIGQYGIMKLAGEHLVKDYARRGHFDYTIVRPSAVYGPRDIEDRVVSKFLITAMQGGTLKVKGQNECLDFTHVDDLAAGLVTASLSDMAVNQTYNLTRSQPRSLIDAAGIAVEIAGRGRIEILDKDEEFPSRAGLDISRAAKELGYVPSINIEDGFRDYYNWLNK